MCGRYASTRSAADLAALFDADDLTEGDLVPDYNIAPTDPAPIVHAGPAGAAVLSVARWGFLPPWAPDPAGAARMINARAETVAGSRAFRDAFAHRRCLVLADGWYEWRPNDAPSPEVPNSLHREGRRRPNDAPSPEVPNSLHREGRRRPNDARSRTRRPYFMTRPEGLVFGGIWSVWGHGDMRRTTFSIITMPAIGTLARIHDRMPLQLSASQCMDWLTSSTPETLLTSPSPDYCSAVEIRPVSAAVGDVRKDGPELVQRVVDETASQSTVDRAPTLF